MINNSIESQNYSVFSTTEPKYWNKLDKYYKFTNSVNSANGILTFSSKWKYFCILSMLIQSSKTIWILNGMENELTMHKTFWLCIIQNMDGQLYSELAIEIHTIVFTQYPQTNKYWLK